MPRRPTGSTSKSSDATAVQHNDPAPAGFSFEANGFAPGQRARVGIVVMQGMTESTPAAMTA